MTSPIDEGGGSFRFRIPLAIKSQRNAERTLAVVTYLESDARYGQGQEALGAVQCR